MFHHHIGRHTSVSMKVAWQVRFAMNQILVILAISGGV